ncbi:MAG TPA: hypothetical protein VK518_12870 [Puia sp.]|nr:hypothetical protein [Puia sp.]
MSLNTIQLQDFIVGELYKETLQPAAAPAAKSAAPADGGQSLAPAGNRASAFPSEAKGMNEKARDEAFEVPASVPEQSEGNERVGARDEAPRSSERGEAAPTKLSGAVQNSQPPTSTNSAPTQPAASVTPTSQSPAPPPAAKPSLGAIAAAMSQSSTAKTPPPVTAPQQSIPAQQPAATQPAASPTQPAAPAPQPAADQPGNPSTTPYKTLGNHRRKITILVNAPDSPFLPDNQLSFLTKILEACRLNMGDVAIVNHASAPVNITALRAQLQPSVILLFGLEPTTIRLPINFPVFKLQPYDQCTYLSAPALDLLVQTSEESKLLKSKLWLCLKSLFEV